VNPKAAQTLIGGVACIVIGVIMGFIGFYSISTGGGMVGGYLFIAAGIIILVGVGCLIGGGVIAAATRKT
jgi:hypothetical protein